MPLLDHLAIERTAIRAIQGKERALREVAALLADGLSYRAEDIYQVLLEREQVQTTGVGSGVAVPHGRLEKVETRVAFIVIPDGVNFDAMDGAPVHFVLGLLSAKEQPSQHLRFLAEASRLFREEARRARLLECADEAALLRELNS